MEHIIKIEKSGAVAGFFDLAYLSASSVDAASFLLLPLCAGFLAGSLS